MPNPVTAALAPAVAAAGAQYDALLALYVTEHAAKISAQNAVYSFQLQIAGLQQQLAAAQTGADADTLARFRVAVQTATAQNQHIDFVLSPIAVDLPRPPDGATVNADGTFTPA